MPRTREATCSSSTRKWTSRRIVSPPFHSRSSNPSPLHTTRSWVTVASALLAPRNTISVSIPWSAPPVSRAQLRGRPLGYDYPHSAVDDRTRRAYTEALPDETDPTCAAFLTRALAFFRDHGIRIRRLLTDNAMVYQRGRCWTAVCSAFELKPRFIKPGCPWTNGKVERFHRTLLVEWAYRRA